MQGNSSTSSRVAGLPGFVRAAARTLSEVQLAGMFAEHLQGLVASGSDNAELLRNYEHQLGDSSLADRAQIFRFTLAGLGVVAVGQDSGNMVWRVSGARASPPVCIGTIR
jgi:hypothetical protein